MTRLSAALPDSSDLGIPIIGELLGDRAMPCERMTRDKLRKSLSHEEALLNGETFDHRGLIGGQ